MRSRSFVVKIAGVATALLLAVIPARATETARCQLRTNDVIALVGGEDVVAIQQHGYLELLLAREAAAKSLRFRNLGWEGDTVFEQRRDLNFPSWEQTLARIGATIIVAQFGQAESLRGWDALPQFSEAAEKLLSRLAGTNRQLLLVAPGPFEKTRSSLPDVSARNADLRAYADALHNLARKHRWQYVDTFTSSAGSGGALTRDGLHLNSAGHWLLATQLAGACGADRWSTVSLDGRTGRVAPASAEKLRQAILTKNQLWFDYWRPQNWAFLAGDRTEQPSSRDHRNPTVRWFPQEMEQFVPLIEAKEREVRELVAKLP